MRTEDDVETVSERLLDAFRKYGEGDIGSELSGKLMQDYLKRFSSWHHAFPGRMSWPWGDLSILLDFVPVTIDDHIESLIKNITDVAGSSVMESKLIHNTLYFYKYYSDFQHIMMNNELSNPYEPILQFFEQGSRAMTHHGEILIGGIQVVFPRTPEYWYAQNLR